MSNGADSTRAHLFSHDKQADAYAKYRPRYSEEVFQAIYDFAGAAQAQTALDVATGSGQAAGELAKRYSRVIAQDPSDAQLAAAEPLGERVQFMRASAEDTQLPDGGVDLITVAQALHWFDLGRFYAEAARVLRPGGTLATWAYELPRIEGEPEASEALQHLYDGTLGPYWDERRRLVEQQYAGMEPSAAQGFEDVQRRSFDMRQTITVGHLLGTISSWSAYNNYRKQHPDKPDPLLVFHGQLKDTLEFERHSDEIDVTYPVFMILAKKQNW